MLNENTSAWETRALFLSPFGFARKSTAENLTYSFLSGLETRPTNEKKRVMASIPHALLWAGAQPAANLLIQCHREPRAFYAKRRDDLGFE